uniref:RRM domain-containing protein n=1 Tax=Echinostoma caproni TaxID=27848 RepID=A0A183BGR1_9TREM
LSSALSAVEAKLLPGLSSTPLQELVLIGAPDIPTETDESKLTNSDMWISNVDQPSNAQRFCQHLATLFRSRFGPLTRIRRASRGDGICYGIV